MRKKIMLSGIATIIQRDKKTGKIIDKEIIKNLVVNSGLERVAKMIGDTESGLSAFSTIALGTDNTAVTANDTSLGTEVKRESVTVTYEASYKVKFYKIFTAGSGESYSIVEAGVFDSLIESGSTMLDRFTFSAKTLDSSNDLEISITITVSAS